jgi:fructokinase
VIVLDIIACGELLIDFVATQTGVTVGQAPAFQKAAGGAPANVAVGMARLGYRAGFLGQVGDDEFGRFLAGALAGAGVDVGGLRFSAQARTALAFVSLRADGERSFMFYRHPSADMLWRPDDVDATYAACARIFHHGSISLIGEPSRSATLTALGYARAGGALISYDPNLRLPLWPSEQAARAGILMAWPLADLIKVSEEELVFLSGETDLERAARALWADRLRLLVVTRGAAGCAYFTRDNSGAVPGFQVPVVDTTGAGDGFVAGLLAGLLASASRGESPSHWRWDAETLEPALRLGNAVGALTTTQRGAIPALPTRAAAAEALADSTICASPFMAPTASASDA